MIPGSMKPVTTSQNMAEAKHAHTKTKSGSDAYHSVTPHVKKKSTIGVSSRNHAQLFGPMSSTGPVMRWPKQQNTLRPGHTSYSRIHCQPLSSAPGGGGGAFSRRRASRKSLEGGAMRGCSDMKSRAGGAQFFGERSAVAV